MKRVALAAFALLILTALLVPHVVSFRYLVTYDPYPDSELLSVVRPHENFVELSNGTRVRITDGSTRRLVKSGRSLVAESDGLVVRLWEKRASFICGFPYFALVSIPISADRRPSHHLLLIATGEYVE